MTLAAGPIVVIAMRTWGELGNLLAARTLAAELEASFGEVTVLEAESFFPTLARTGETIRGIAVGNDAPDAKRHRYREMMKKLDEAVMARVGDFPAGIDELARHLERANPRLVVAVKGLIARLAVAALPESGGVRVVNYVTNPGLLELPIHRCPEAWNFVPFELNRDELLRRHGFPGDRVLVVGKLLPFTAPAVATASTPTPRRGTRAGRIVVLANRGGPRFMRLIDELAQRAPTAEVSVIALGDADLVQRVAYHQRVSRVAHWRVQHDLAQADYGRVLGWLTAASRPVLISKTGPNAMLEAVHAGIPQILLDSGLPMERWVSDFVTQAGIGAVVEEGRQAVDVLIGWDREPQRYAQCRRRARGLSARLLNQESARLAHRDAFAAVLQPEHRGTEVAVPGGGAC